MSRYQRMQSQESTFMQKFRLKMSLIWVNFPLIDRGSLTLVGIPSFINLKTFRQATTEDERKAYAQYTAFEAINGTMQD